MKYINHYTEYKLHKRNIKVCKHNCRGQVLTIFDLDKTTQDKYLPYILDCIREKVSDIKL